MTTSIATRLDLGVAQRHAFGKSYERPTDLESRLIEYRDGVLSLPPHPNWVGDFTDWTANPFSDRNWQFQHHTLRWTNVLRWAALEGDGRARDEWVRVAQSWFDANVPTERSESPFAWMDMADGNRAVQLALGAPLVSEGAEWFIELLDAHRAWLMDDEHIVGGNHGLHQNAGLLVVGACLRDAKAMERARDRLASAFLKAFDEQGCNEEGSAAYHQLNIRWWRGAWERVAAEGLVVPVAVGARLEAAQLVLAHLTQPDGQLPQIGDSARTRVGAGISDVTDFVASRGTKGEHPGATTLVLDGGYAVSRSGWGEVRAARDESHALIRHGRYVRAHGHHDSGSVHIYAGRRWLVDPGFHSYQFKDRTRNHLSSREAHNVPVLKGLTREVAASFELARWTSTNCADDFHLIDRGYADARLERRVTYLKGPDCWIVWDRALAEIPVTLEQHWQTDVGVVTRQRDRGFRLSDGSRSLSMTWLSGESRRRRHDAVDGDLTGWIGTRWKTLEKGTHITASTTGVKPQLVTLIGAHSPAALGVVDSYVTGGEKLTLTLLRGGDSWTAVVGGGVSVERR